MGVETALFTFGTLMDPEVLQLVSGQSVKTMVREPAEVAGHARRWVLDDHYPVLVANAACRTSGLIIRGLEPEAMQRIEFFEGEEFSLELMQVERLGGHAERVSYFASNHRQPISDQEWLLEEWQRTTKQHTMPRVERYMQCYGRMSVAEADAYW